MRCLKVSYFSHTNSIVLQKKKTKNYIVYETAFLIKIVYFDTLPIILTLLEVLPIIAYVGLIIQRILMFILFS